MRNLDRRELLLLFGASVTAPFILTFEHGTALAASAAPTSLAADTRGVFDLSIASGDPSQHGIVLWTHIRSDLHDPSTSLWFQIATDANFSALVVEGRLQDGAVGPDRDYTVSVTVEGPLASGTRYYYRFIYGNVVSSVGRCRSLPGGSPTKVKLALLTCQDFTNGYYAALGYVAADDSVDFVVHIGDFIYESVGDPRFQDRPFADRYLYLPSGSGVALGLADYRYLYRTYRSDANLRALLEQHTLLSVPDDHETANDAYWDYERDTLGAPDHPFVEASDLTRLKLDSQRAWLEYVPSRVTASPAASHPHDYSRVYRAFDFGDLARLSLLDTRTYRTAHPCGEADLFERYLPVGCTRFTSGGQTLLGDAQKDWLEKQLTSARATWKVIGNQTLFSPMKLGYGSTALPVNVDSWDGYQAERNWLTKTLKDKGIKNTVIITGDMHSYVASQLLRDFNDLNPLHTGNILGAEFMTPSLTSSNLLETLAGELNGTNPALLDGLSDAAIRLNNPHIRYFNSSQYGYSTLELRRDYCEWTAYAVDKNVTSATRTTVARLRQYTFWPWLVEA